MLPSVLMWSDAGPDSDMKTGGMCVYAGDDNAGIMDGLLHRCFRESWVIVLKSSCHCNAF